MNQHPVSPAAVVRVLAELSGSGRSQASVKTNQIEKAANWSWEGAHHLGLFSPTPGPEEMILKGGAGSRLASIDALQPTSNVLRAGWLWVSGKATADDGTSRTYCFPVLWAPVVLSRGPLGLKMLGRIVRRAGDVESSSHLGPSLLSTNLSDLAIDPETGRPTGVTRSLISDLLGLPIDRVLGPEANPWTIRRFDGLALVAGVGIYTSTVPANFSLRTRLNEWVDQPLEDTAFARLYASKPTLKSGPTPPPPAPVPPESNSFPPTRPLSPTQARVLAASATQPIVTVSGPPGTGKTHTMVELALAAMARGESVLLGAASPHAIDVIANHFESRPGPSPITFGGQRRSDTEDQISHRLTSTPEPMAFQKARRHQAKLQDQVDELAASVARLLRAESLAANLEADPATRLAMEDRYGSAGDPDDHRRLLRLVRDENGPLDRLRRRSRRQQLTRALGLTGQPSLEELAARIDDIDDYLLARRSLAEGGLTLEASFDRLYHLDGRASDSACRILDALADDLLARSTSGRVALGDLSTAMRSSRNRRRQILAELPSSSLTQAAPLWLGAVRDIDDVLPPTPAMFDLVVLDEASQIDQPAAAGALLRARRAVICGDSRQLRHVSFVSEAAIATATRSILGFEHPTLDVRSNSLFDVASAAGTGFNLDEHFRCDPHLISFSARRFYDGHLHVATTNPLNHSTDRIEIVDVPGGRDDDRVNRAQVAAALARIDSLAAEGSGTIGVVSPFRDQTDALTDAVLQTYRAEEIEDMGLSIGTVHAFQGSEHDAVIIMLTVGPDEARSAWSFVNRPNLFNVMITRARHRVIVLNSDPDAPGLAGEYLVHADPLRTPPPTRPPDTDWSRRIAAALSESGQPFWSNYTAGLQTVDFALISGDRPVALIVEPHSDGAEAHIRREIVLRRLGWTVRDAFASRWSGRLGELAASLATQGVDFDS